jgi:hypothetical protein
LTPIKENQFDTNNWFEEATEQRSSMVGSGDGTLPSNKLDALTAIYTLLWKPDALNWLLGYGHSVMFSKSYDEQLKKVNSHLTHRFIRYIIRELEEKMEPLKPQTNGSITNNFTVTGNANIAAQSSGFTQNLTINNPEVKEIIAELRGAINNSQLPDDEKESANETADMIEEELGKDNPKPSRITKLLALLPYTDSLLGIREKIIALISQ